MTVVLVLIGGALGAPLRYLTDLLVQARHDSILPWGTLTVNVVGSFVLGAVAAAVAVAGAPSWLMTLLGTGFCGALTTYSSFAVHTHDRGPRLGTLNVLVTLVPALLLCGLGFWVGAR